MNKTYNTTILCVDDEEDILAAYRDILVPQNTDQDEIMNKWKKRTADLPVTSESNDGTREIDYTLICAESGEGGIQCVTEQFNKGIRIAVGFFDMTMPGGIDGTETIKRILKIDPEIICVIVTAYPNRDIAHIVSLFGSQDQWIYMNKPFNRFEIQQTAYCMVSLWNRRSKEKEHLRIINNLNSRMEEKVRLKTSELEKRINELNLINQIAKKINTSLDPDDVLETIMNSSSELLHAIIGSILLVDENNTMLSVKSAYGPFTEVVMNKSIEIDDSTVSGYIVRNREPILIRNMDRESRFKDVIQQRKICGSLISVPLIIKDQIIGVMHLGRNELFVDEDLNFFITLADQAAIAIDNARLYKSHSDKHIQVIRALAAAIDAKDPYTNGHSDRVTKLAISIARQMGWLNSEIEILKQAGHLHDIGKIGISETILNKQGPLSAKEFDEIKKHSAKGGEIVEHINFDPKVKKYIRHHHERFDGKGYPDRLKGEDIPIGARILCVADAYDAMTSNRCYRRALSLLSSWEELKKGAGTQFDPLVVEAFFKLFS